MKKSLPRSWTLLLTCEHAGVRVPAAYAECFQTPEAHRALQSHRGSDLGSATLARQMQAALQAPLLRYDVTRLLVEVNRSLGHPRLFSEFTRELTRERRAEILARYYHPHRRAIQQWIESAVAQGRSVVHVGVHSFTPIWKDELRNADVGLLYDPAAEVETTFCKAWQSELRRAHGRLRVRRNYPYRGRDDGLTTALRQVFPASKYVGLELEVNQASLSQSPQTRSMAKLLATTLAATLSRKS